MKRLIISLITVFTVILLPTFAYADVAAPGVIAAVSYLPNILLAVVLVVLIVVLIASIRNRRKK